MQRRPRMRELAFLVSADFLEVRARSARGSSVALHLGDLARPLHALALEGLLLAIENGGGLLEELPLLPLPDDPLLLDLALEALDRLLEGLIIAHFDVGYVDSPPFGAMRSSNVTEIGAFVKERRPRPAASGSTGTPMASTSQCRWGPVARPVMPDLADDVSLSTTSPTFTRDLGHVIIDGEKPGKMLDDDRVPREDPLAGETPPFPGRRQGPASLRERRCRAPGGLSSSALPSE